MLERLSDPETWLEFLAYKLERGLIDAREEDYLRGFISERRYLETARAVERGECPFVCPERREISKLGTGKKRVLYTFGDELNTVLKLLAYLLYRYDERMPPNCYAFRRDIGARRAFTDIASAPGIASMWCFKADVSNYFNSINAALLSEILRETITDDGPLLELLLAMINDERCVWRGEIIREQKGAMAGTPTSPFFANLYLCEMDRYFYEKNVIYARYSDDVIIFAPKSELETNIADYRAFLERYRLRCNPDKEALSAPGEAWSFLGFERRGGITDISRASVSKLMGKIRRKARSLRRWSIKKGAQPERALRAFNRSFNKKFFGGPSRELCWSRWYFSLINTDASLRAIDEYMQLWQRYIVTGKHNKASLAAAPYELLRGCGYRPLVSAYYADRKAAAKTVKR